MGWKTARRLIDRPLIHIVFIAAVGVLVYSNTFHAPFQWDDGWNIIDNPAIKDFSTFIDPPKGSTHYGFFMRRIGYLTFALNYMLHGLDTTGYHIVNIVIHIVSAMLVYSLVGLTFKTPALKDHPLKESAHYMALFAALLFVSHPVQTQAVTYIVQRFTSLAAFFYLASLVLYIKWRLAAALEQRSGKGISVYILSLLFAALAMKTKENAFTLPIVMALYEFMFFEGSLKRRLLRLVPFMLTMSIIPLGLLYLDRPIGILVADDAAGPAARLSRADYLFTEFRVIVTYLRLLAFPVNQNIDYDYPLFNSFLDVSVFASFLFLIMILLFAVYLYKRGHRLPAFGIFWFYIALSVESGPIAIVDVIFEHRLYLPSAGFFLAASYCAALLLGRLSGARLKAGASALIAAIFLFSAAAYTRNMVWESGASLWEDTVEKSPLKKRGFYNLANEYREQGRYDEAIANYKKTLTLQPDDVNAIVNLGIAYYGKGLNDKAIEYYLFALGYEPDAPDIFFRLGLAYHVKGMFDEATNYYREAIRLKPDYLAAHYNLGIVYYKEGLLKEAREEIETVLSMNPGHQEARQLLGRILLTDRGSSDKKKGTGFPVPFGYR